MSKLGILGVILMAVAITLLALPAIAAVAHMVIGLTRMVWGI